ncbi:MAG: hypothetical protein RMI91_11070 [Gemmatales bacterium]|nr:hypothetical protein [Gemmatales bacterium]MDW7995184.1 hypothetical protein [Gemmatales bacterium]
MKRARFRSLGAVTLLATVWLVLTNDAEADLRSRAIREVAEYVLRKFSKEAVGETVETLARRLERQVAKHGDDALRLVQAGGPKALHTLEEVGEHAPKLLKFHARHGDEAIWVITRPRSTAIFLKYGDDAGAALLRHGEIVEPIIEQHGRPAATALARMADSQQARRLAMMHQDGSLAKIGRTEELLEVIARKTEPGWADRTMDFIWRHKGALAVTAALTAFLADPEPFINGLRDLTEVAAENTVGKVSGEIARSINWTLIIGITIVVIGTLFLARRIGSHYLKKQRN